MEITRLADLKPRNVWEITDDAFDLYRERFALLASISAVVFAPTLLLYNIVAAGIFGHIGQITDSPTYAWGAYRDLAWSLPLMGMAYTIQIGATAIAVRDILTGETTTLGSAYKRLFKKFFPILLAAIMVGLITLVSFCFIIGPILVMAWYTFVPHTLLLEDRKLLDAAKRSRDIGSNYFGKIFGLLCLMTSITYLLTLGFQGIIEMAFSILPTAPNSATPYELEATKHIVTTVSSSIITILFTPLSAIATTLLYYDLRVRREGLDIESEAEEWNVPLAPDPFGGVLNPKLPKPQKSRLTP